MSPWRRLRDWLRPGPYKAPPLYLNRRGCLQLGAYVVPPPAAGWRPAARPSDPDQRAAYLERLAAMQNDALGTSQAQAERRLAMSQQSLVAQSHELARQYQGAIGGALGNILWRL